MDARDTQDADMPGTAEGAEAAEPPGNVVKGLAAAPLTPAAVRELLSLADADAVDEDAFDEVAEETYGWRPTDLVGDAALTRHGHVLSYDEPPLGDPTAATHLVFAEAYPWVGEREDEKWLSGLLREWSEGPGWEYTAGPTLAQCEAVLARAAEQVGAVLGPPLRTVPSDGRLSMGPYVLCRVWRRGGQAVVLGPVSDNGPYGYLTHFALCTAPWPDDDPLPADDEAACAWVARRIDW